MFIKHDFSYEELKPFISEENVFLYELIKKNGKQDEFTYFIENYYNDRHTVTMEELNVIMNVNRLGIVKALKLKG